MHAAQSQAQKADQELSVLASAHQSTVAALQAQVQAARTQAQQAQSKAHAAGQEMAARKAAHKGEVSALQAAMVTKAEALQATMMQVGGVVLLCSTPFCLPCPCMLSTFEVVHCVHALVWLGRGTAVIAGHSVGGAIACICMYVCMPVSRDCVLTDLPVLVMNAGTKRSTLQTC